MHELWTTRLGRGESTLFLADNIQDLSQKLGSYGQNVMWVFDTHTANMFRTLPVNHIVLEPGEEYKSLDSLTRIVSHASRLGMGRDSRFIAFGGGVVCDITALAASLYMRGASLTLVPTTLLAMCDASLGGKTAIDFNGHKNLIGSFYPADEILYCIDTLNTLSDSEFLNGMGEVLKHALLSGDSVLYRYLITHGQNILRREKAAVREMVVESLKVKHSYIEKDPLETKGIRSALNLGHTFGHALESTAHLSSLSHGRCVAWGCVRALEASQALKLCDPQWAEGCIKLFKAYGYNTDYKIGRGEWIEFSQHLKQDKKKLDGRVRFILPVSQGRMETMPLEESLIQKLVIMRY